MSQAARSLTKLVLDRLSRRWYKCDPPMLSPEPGDVLIRNEVSGFTVVDAVNLRELSGPHLSTAAAFVAARGLVSTGHVWRDNLDGRGRTIGQPFLLELQPSTLA